MGRAIWKQPCLFQQTRGRDVKPRLVKIIHFWGNWIPIEFKKKNNWTSGWNYCSWTGKTDLELLFWKGKSKFTNRGLTSPLEWCQSTRGPAIPPCIISATLSVWLIVMSYFMPSASILTFRGHNLYILLLCFFFESIGHFLYFKLFWFCRMWPFHSRCWVGGGRNEI